MIQSEGHHIYQLAKVAAETTGAAAMTVGRPESENVEVRRYFFMAQGYKLHSDKQCLPAVCSALSNSQILHPFYAALLAECLINCHCSIGFTA